MEAFFERVITAIYLFVALAVISLWAQAPTAAQKPPQSQQRAIVSAWNECVESVKSDYAYLLELQKSLQREPPWRTVDASRDHAKHRADLIDKIIVEHRKRIELLEKIKREDSK